MRRRYAVQIEDLAVRGPLEEARPLVERLEAMVGELIDQVDGLSIETLRHQVGSRARAGVAPIKPPVVRWPGQ